MDMKKLITIAMALALSAASGFAGTIRITGSDSMAELNRKLAAAYSAAHPDVKITVTPCDTTTGINALIGGTTEIAAAARAIKPAETAKLPNLSKAIVGKDGVALYVHTSNKVKVLTLKQAGEVLAGQITNWKQVGGADGAIHVIGRVKGAASLTLLDEAVLRGRPIVASKETSSVAENLDAVGKDPQAFGFGGAVHPDKVRAIALTVPGSPQPVRPDAESVNRGVYPLTRTLYYYMNTTPTGDLQGFLDFVGSDQGQKIVTDSGLFRVK
jgi:phosphate transport system substrate-binding protein